MTSQSLEPTPASLSGDTAGMMIKRWILATRPKFFTASVLPVLVGFAWGYHTGGALDSTVLALALAATVLVHAASNVYNDVGDDINGSDRNNTARIYPYTGGSRFIPNGVLSRAEMTRLSIVLFGMAALVGGALVAIKGPTVLWMGLAGIALGVFYSMPRIQLIAHGLGEVTIAIAFGVLPVAGSAWLVTGRLDSGILWISLAVGLWVTAILQINEVPDIAADEAAGKRTLAVRLREPGVAKLYFLLHAAAFLIIAGLVVDGQLPMGILSVPLLLLALALKAATGITPPPYPGLVKSIEMTLAIQLIGCLWLAGYFVYLS